MLILTTTHVTARNEGDLILPAFNPMDSLAIPSGATHCRFITCSFSN